MIGRRAVAVAGLVLATSGCAISYEGARDLRQEKDAKSLEQGAGKCNEFLAEEVGIVPRRAMVMETGALVSKQNGYKASNATLYNRLVELLKAEAKNPKVHPDATGGDDGAYLRAWAVYCLGILEDDALIEYFIGCASDADLNASSGCRAQVAALDALVPLLEPLRKSPVLRNKLLAAIPRIRSKFPKANVANGEGAARDKLLDFFAIELKTLDNLTNVVQQCAADSVGVEPWLEALTWDYQILHESVGKKAKEATTEQYGANVAALLPIVHHSEPKVRAAARTIFQDVAPGTLFDRLVATAADKPEGAREDLEMLAGMLPRIADVARRYAQTPPGGAYVYYDAGVGVSTLNEVAFLSSAAMSRSYGELTRAAFAFCAAEQAEAREYLYACLFEFDPVLLAKHLVAIESKALRENRAARAQHVRYLGNLLSSPRVVANATLQEAVAVSLSHMVWVDDPAQQKQVASYLLASRPDTLAAACAVVMREVARMSAPGAEGLLNLYLDALARFEKANGIAGYAASPYMKAVKDAPYPVLGRVFDRPEGALRGKVIAFLTPRDPAKLIDILAASLAAQKKPRSFELAALNDVLLGKKAVLRESAIKVGVDSLAACLVRTEEDNGLLIVRCLAELQHEAAFEALDIYRRSGKCRIESIKTLVVAAVAAWGK